MAEPVDWPALMRLGLGLLRLPPDVFWSMTPGEFRRALEGAGATATDGRAMHRGRLRQLMAAFPDKPAGAQSRAGMAQGTAASPRRETGASRTDGRRGAAGPSEGWRDEL